MTVRVVKIFGTKVHKETYSQMQFNSLFGSINGDALVKGGGGGGGGES